MMFTIYGSCSGRMVSASGDVSLLMGGNLMLTVEDLLDLCQEFSRGDLLGSERSLDVTFINEAMLFHNTIKFMDHCLGMSSSMSNDIVQRCDKNVMLCHRLDVTHLHLHMLF